MISALAKPWLRLPQLLAVYAAVAIGAPCLFFVAYELSIALQSFKSYGINAPTVLLILIILALIIVPNLYKRLRRSKEVRELLCFPDMSAQFTSSFIGTIGLGIYIKEKSEQARAYRQAYRRMVSMMQFMVANVEKINLSDESLDRYRETKELLDKTDRHNGSEFHVLLTQFLSKYDDVHSPDETET